MKLGRVDPSERETFEERMWRSAEKAREREQAALAAAEKAKAAAPPVKHSPPGYGKKSRNKYKGRNLTRNDKKSILVQALIHKGISARDANAMVDAALAAGKKGRPTTAKLDERVIAETWARLSPDDTSYRPKRSDPLLVGAGRATGDTARAVKRRNAMTKYEIEQG